MKLEVDGKCRLCASSKLIFKYEVGSCSLQCCRACGLFQVKDRPSIEQLRAIYSAGYFNHTKYESTANIKEQNRRLKWVMKSGVAPNSTLLDFGCATGDFLSLAKKHFDVYGCDLSLQAIQVAKKNNPDIQDKLFSGLLSDIQFDEKKFDLIVLWDVIEHVWDPSVLIKNLSELLKPGGKLLFSTPNIGASIAKLMGKRWAFMTPPEHLVFFDKSTIARLLERNNFQLKAWMTRGKWVNLGFLFYKFKRVFPMIMPNFVVKLMAKAPFKFVNMYIPTRDIQYISAVIMQNDKLSYD